MSCVINANNVFSEARDARCVCSVKCKKQLLRLIGFNIGF